MYTIKKILKIIRNTIVFCLLASFVALQVYIIYTQMVPTVQYDFNSYDEFKNKSALYSEQLPESAQEIRYYYSKVGFISTRKSAISYLVSDEDYNGHKQNIINNYISYSQDPNQRGIKYYEFNDYSELLINSSLYSEELKYIEKLIDINSKDYYLLVFLSDEYSVRNLYGTIVNDKDNEIVEFHYYRSK